MATSKQSLAGYLLKSPVGGENHHLVGSSLEVVMDKFSTFAYPNWWLWLASTRQSEPSHSSSQHPSNSSTHKGIIEFYHSWCGSYYILVRDWLTCFQVAHCKITTQLSQAMLGIANHIGTMCNAKLGSEKYDTPVLTYKGPNNVEYEFWFWPDNIQRCVSGSKKIYVFNWPTVPNMWTMKIGTNLSK